MAIEVDNNAGETEPQKKHSFKSDKEFLAYISMGAAGVRAVVENLRSQGHEPLILERGSDDFKLWKSTRIKGWRVPDVLCVNDATRVEVRAKSEFRISGSHSTGKAERQWSYGLNENDYMAFPVCRLVGTRIIDWEALPLIQYVRVGDLKSAFDAGMTQVTDAKAASQGSEKQVVWPVVVAGSDGEVVEATSERFVFKRVGDNRKIPYKLTRKGGITLTLQVGVAETVVEGQVLASVVPVVRAVPVGARVGADHYIEELRSSNERVRFAAAKALSGFTGSNIDEALVTRLNDANEHVFVRLEAAASLARHGNSAGWAFFENTIGDQFAENRLECCIVLAEVRDARSRDLLVSKLQQEDEHVDVRAGAAWALGEHRSVEAMSALADAFTARREEIRVEAARALTKLAKEHRMPTVELFKQVSDAARPAVAFALRRGAGATTAELQHALQTDDMRQWVAYVIGTGQSIEEIEKLKQLDREVFFAATLLWKMLTSGIYHLEEYG